jgi:hypothetical protein
MSCRSHHHHFFYTDAISW